MKITFLRLKQGERGFHGIIIWALWIRVIWCGRSVSFIEKTSRKTPVQYLFSETNFLRVFKQNGLQRVLGVWLISCYLYSFRI